MVFETVGKMEEEETQIGKDAVRLRRDEKDGWDDIEAMVNHQLHLCSAGKK